MTASNNETPEGDLDLQITETAGLGVHVSGISKGLPSKLEPISRIILVDGVPVKGLPIDKIREMFRGPVGSKVTLDVLTIHAQMVRVVLERQIIKRHSTGPEPANALRQALEMLDAYDGLDQPTAYQHAVSSCERVGLEPVASALTYAAIGVCDNWFDKDSVTAKFTLMQAASYFDRVGRISEADGAIARAMSAIKKMESSDFWEERFLLDFATHLAKTGRTLDAEAVYQQLKACSERWEGGPERRLAVLKPYAHFLSASGRNQEASAAYDEIVRLSEDKSSPNLQSAADFYADDEQLAKSIDTYQKFIAAAESKWTETQRSFDRDRPLVHAMYKLACVQERALKVVDAIATLKKALDVYKSRLDDSKQVETELMPLFFPTVSDIEVKLAELFARENDFGASVFYLESAVEKIEKALGRESSYLRQPLSELSKSLEALGRSAEAHKALARSHAIKPIDQIVLEQKEDEYYSVARFFKALKSKDFVTTGSALEMLLTQLEAFGDGSDNHRRRTRACNYLSYFSTLLADEGRFDDCRQLIERLTMVCSSFEESPAMLYGVLTEKAIFAKELGLPEEPCWQELEESLKFQAARLQTAPRSDERPALEKPDLAIDEKLRRWSLAYYFVGDYKRAAAIQQRIQSRFFGGTTTDNLSADSELMPVMLAEQALIDLRCSNFEAANRAITKILSGARNIGPTTGAKLLQLAMTYDELSHSTDAKQLLRDAINLGLHSGQNNDHKFGVPGLYRLKLAQLLARDGELEQALEQLLEAQALYKTTVPAFKLLWFAAELNRSLGRNAETARHYLAIHKRLGHAIGADPSLTDLSRQVLRRALAAADKTDELSTDERVSILKGLAEHLQGTNRDESVQLFKRAIQLLPDDSKESAAIARNLALLYSGPKKDLDTKIQAQKKAALLAESSDISSAYYSWLLLASSEVEAGEIANAVAHIEYAIDLFKTHAKKTHFTPLITSKGIANSLRHAGNTAKAEHLLKEAADATHIICGDSVEYSLSLAELATFYADERNYSEVALLVERILQNYSSNEAQLPLNSHSHVDQAIRRLYDIASQLAGQGCYDQATAIDLKILSIQRTHLPSDNIQIADTLFALGTLHKLEGDYESAEPLFLELIQINKKHWGNHRMTLFYESQYAEVLRKLGKFEEAEQLLTLHSVAETESAKETLKRVSLDFEVKRLESKNELESARELLESAYETAKAQAPYGSESIKALDLLAKFFVRHKDNERAELAYRKLVQIFDTGVSSVPGQMSKSLVALARILIDEGRKDEAAEALKKAKKRDPELHADRQSFQCLRNYAELEVEVGQTEEAIKHLELAEQRLREQTNNNSAAERTYLSAMAELWKKLGLDDKADSAMNRLSELKQKDHSTRVERLNRPRIVANTDSANDTASDANFGPYMADIERRVKRAWFPENGRPEREVQVIFHIHRGGEVSNLRLSRSSGKATEDQSAIKAIQNAAPFRPLPPGAGDFEKFEFTFGYQTFTGSGDGAVRRI